MSVPALRDVSALGELRGRRVLVRSDLNVPMNGAQIADDGRIRASVPTIARLADAGARVVVCSHLGRPDGSPDPAYSLGPVAERLAELLGRPVAFASDVVGSSAHETVARLRDGDVALLENVRFCAGETRNDPAFAAELAGLCDAFVGDAFGAAHRAHASTAGVPARLPHAAGGLVLAELDVLRRLTDRPDRPYAVVLGGSKVSDKLAVLGNLLRCADRILVGGGMCFTFLAAQGHDVGGSLLQPDQIDAVREVLRNAADRGVEIVLPVDVVAAADVTADAVTAIVDATAIPADLKGLDIGPRSAKLFAERLADTRTVFWNGPMGVFELPPFAAGTRSVAEAVADLGATGALSVVGGGDSAAAVRSLGIDEARFGHISTGGGASLEFLEGKRLPGLDALT
ncbi:MAG TPA: phosphoglycerate kinase [Mycobacteriales bacterium]|nr:phosphoglycerate kinase [Mycobacteriales bacterium]